jgi:general secretion pathway protein C
MGARALAFVVWAVVMGSLMYWGLRLLVRGPVAPAYTVSAVDAQSMRGDFAKVFGAPPPAAALASAPVPAAASRFKLLGVAAPVAGQTSTGLALISMDGKAARAYPVGRTVGDGWVLQSVSRRGARLSSNLGADTVDLEAPLLASASRGTLPPVSNTIEGPSSGSTNESRAPVVPFGARPNGGAAPYVPSATGGVPAPNVNNPAGSSVPPATTPAPPPMPRESMPTSRRDTANTVAATSGGPPTIFVPPEELKAAQERR